MKSQGLIELVTGLGRPRILIVGDLILDRYVSGDVRRISPEAPIPVLAAGHEELRIGGAGNVCANLRAMEASVELLSVVGEDAKGRRLLELLAEIEVAVDGVAIEPGRRTTEKTRLVSGVNQMLRVDWEESHEPAPDTLERLQARIPRAVAEADAVVLSDYGKGMLSGPVIELVVQAAREAGKPVLVDPKGNDFTRYRGATLVTPNRKEAEEAVGRPLAQLADLPEAAADLIEAAELDAVVITLGPEGIYWRTGAGEERRAPTQARRVFDVVGAGDTVIAHLALGLGAPWWLKALLCIPAVLWAPGAGWARWLNPRASRLQEVIDAAWMSVVFCVIDVAIARLTPGKISLAAALSAVKFAVCAAAGCAVGWAFGLGHVAFGVLVLQFATPAGVSTYLLAEKYEADADSVAGIVVVSTLMAVGALPLLLAFLL